MQIWTRFHNLSKRNKVLWGSVATLLVVSIILVVALIIKLKAAGNTISNYATVTWDDASGHHTANSNTVTTEVLANATSVVYSLQNVGTRDHSGTVSLVVYNQGGTTPVETQSVDCSNTGSGTASGSVTLGIANGTYDFDIKEPTHLSKKLSGVAYSSGSAPTLNFGNLFGADLNSDNVVNTADYSRLISNWFGTGVADINRDGAVNTADYSVMISNWFMAGN